jgi:hypothetical protein
MLSRADILAAVVDGAAASKDAELMGLTDFRVSLTGKNIRL